MKKLILLSVVLLILFLSGCNMLDLNDESNYDEWSLFGQVLIEGTELPAKNIHISLNGQTTVTDNNGNFFYDNLTQSSYEIYAEGVGFESISKIINKNKTEQVSKLYLKPLESKSTIIDLAIGGAIDVENIKVKFPSNGLDKKVVVKHTPFRKINLPGALSTQSTDDIVQLDARSEIIFDGLSDEELNIPVIITVAKDDLYDEAGNMLTVLNTIGEEIPFIELMANREELYSDEVEEVSIYIDNLADYLHNVEETDLQAYMSNGQVTPQFFGRFMKFLISKFTVNHTAVANGVTDWLEERSNFRNILLPYAKNVNQDYAIIYVHGLGADLGGDDLTRGFYQEHINFFENNSNNFYAYIHHSATSSEYNGKLLAESINNYCKDYNKIYIVAHSNGGLVVQEALYYADQQRMNIINKVENVILLGSPLGGVGKTVSTVGGIFWLTQIINGKSIPDHIIDTKLYSEKTYRWILKTAVFETTLRLSNYNYLINGVRSVVKDSNIYERNGINLYLLAGSKQEGLAQLVGYSDEDDQMKNILLSLINAFKFVDIRHDGLVSVSSALRYPEATDTITLEVNHYEMLFTNNGAFDWLLSYLPLER